MTDYTGLKCPVCGKAFTAQDDIVVCPDCGAPYHRTCYAQAGKCVFSEKHSTSYTWTPPQTENHEQNSESLNHCPRCGCPNSEHALFCQHCGLPLSANQQNANGFPYGGFPQDKKNSPYDPPRDPNNSNAFPHNGLPETQIPFIFDPMGGVNPNEPIDDVPAGDLAKLVQNNTQYYLPVFMNEKKFGHNRFNFSAFIFSGGWLLYRKQYKIGAIITSVMVALHLISLYISLNFASPMLQTFLQQAGVSSDTFAATYAQIIKFWELLFAQPWYKIVLCSLPTFISLVEFVIMLIVGFSGNKWYSKFCIGKVKKIHIETQNAPEWAIRFQEEGGVNTALAICMIICYTIILYISNLY